MRKFFIAALFLILPSMASAGTDTAALRQTLLNLVNMERQAANLPVLALNSLLTQAAERKAADMMAVGYFEHQNPSGKEFYQWIDESGYQYSIAGENLAANIYTISADKMVESWMNSPTHRANVVSGKFSETGMAVVSGTFQDKPTVFAVQVFAHPKQVQVTAPPAVQEISPNIPAVVEAEKIPVVVVETPKPKTIKAATKPEQAIEKVATTTAETARGVLVLAAKTPAPQPILASFFQKVREFFLNFF